MLRYAITDRRLFPGDEAARLEGLAGQVRRLSAAGVDVLQVREKDLPAAALLTLMLRLRAEVPVGRLPRLLVNAGVAGEVAVGETCAVARVAGADGVHLPGKWTMRGVAGALGYEAAGGQGRLLVSVACHTVTAVAAAVRAGVDFILFSPVFGKEVDAGAGERGVVAGVGLEGLRAAVAAAAETPVLALGGVTAENAGMCVRAGAAGVAGIRLFARL